MGSFLEAEAAVGWRDMRANHLLGVEIGISSPGIAIRMALNSQPSLNARWSAKTSFARSGMQHTGDWWVGR